MKGLTGGREAAMQSAAGSVSAGGGQSDVARDSTGPRVEIHPLTLRFSPRQTELAYRAQLNEESLPLLRLALVAGVFAISAFYPSDMVLFPDDYQLMWGVRTALLLPAVILALGASFLPSFPRFRGPFVWLAVSASGWAMPFGLIWYGPSGLMYFTSGTIIAAMFGLLMLGLQFVFAIFTTWTFVLVAVAAIAYEAPELLAATTAIQILLVSCAILTIAAYRIQSLSRRLYLKSLQVIEEQERVRASEAHRSFWLEQMAGFFRHELKNSVLGVETSLELLARHTGDDSPFRPYVDRAQKGIQLIDSIARGVSNATSLESTFYREQPAAVRLDSLIKEELATYRNAYAACEFVYQCRDTSLEIQGREERVIQMLDNLLTNAVDHHTSGTPITVTVGRRGGRAILEVANKGPLLPADSQVLFDLFRSFRGAKAPEHHHGIGLYLVRLIAQRYGGEVEAENQADGSGVTFRVLLPCAPQPVAEPACPVVTHR